MIIFLITELGNTKENCGIWRKMPRASPIRSAVFLLFFFLFLNFVCDFFGLLKHIPIILRSHSKFPMPQLHCAARESPGALGLGGCRHPQQWCKAGRVSWLATVCFLPGLLNWPGGVIFFLSLFPSVTNGFLPLSMDGLHSNASHYSFILRHGKLWRLGRAKKRSSDYLGNIQWYQIQSPVVLVCNFSVLSKASERWK